MATNELISVDSPSWLNKWSMPFWWIILAPIVTVPLSAILFSGLAGYLEPPEVGLPDRTANMFIGANAYSEVVPTLIAFTLPGLLNLAPIIWTLSAKPRVRMAGVVAGLLGLVRLGMPLAVLMLGFDRLTNASGTSYFDFVTEGLVVFWGEPHDVIWFFGAVAWLGSLLVWGSFATISYVYEELTGNTDHGKEGV